MIGFINPFMLHLLAAALSLEYLRRLLQPPAPPTSPVSLPYTPPFSGGQCAGNSYSIIIGATFKSGATSRTYYFTRGFSSGTTNLEGLKPFANAQPAFIGAIPSPTFSVSGITGTARFGSVGSINYAISVFEPPFGFSLVTGSEFVAWIRNRTNPSDSCGDIPNPIPAPPVASDGLADSAPLEVVDDDELVIGAPLVTIPSIGAIVAAIAAAVRAASDALAAIKELVNAIETIGEILDKIREWIEDRDKENDNKKSLYRHDYGSVRKDGFLRLYPNGEQNGFSPQYLDLQLLSIPISYGKYFGNLSPNFYRFKSLGHISFVSPSFGVLSTHELEFSRISLTVPDNAFGFFYHLGLDDTIRANVSLFYLKNQ